MGKCLLIKSNNVSSIICILFIFYFKQDNTNIPHLGLSPRIGSEKDKKDLARCLQRLDFHVEEHDNVKHLELWAVLERGK